MRLPQIEPLRKFDDPGLNIELRNIYSLLSRLFAKGIWADTVAPDNAEFGMLWYNAGVWKIYNGSSWDTI